MVANDGERTGQVAEDAHALMDHFGGFAVHDLFGANHFPAKSRTDRLMTETDTQHWHFSGKVLEQINTDAGLSRGAGAGRKADVIRFECFYFSEGEFVVTKRWHIFTQLTKILHQV